MGTLKIVSRSPEAFLDRTQAGTILGRALIDEGLGEPVPWCSNSARRPGCSPGSRPQPECRLDIVLSRKLGRPGTRSLPSVLSRKTARVSASHAR